MWAYLYTKNTKTEATICPFFYCNYRKWPQTIWQWHIHINISGILQIYHSHPILSSFFRLDFKGSFLISCFESKNHHCMGFSIHVWTDGMFIWLVHTGYIHGGFHSKCPIVTIIESVWGPVEGHPSAPWGFFNQVLAPSESEYMHVSCRCYKSKSKVVFISYFTLLQAITSCGCWSDSYE